MLSAWTEKDEKARTRSEQETRRASFNELRHSFAIVLRTEKWSLVLLKGRVYGQKMFYWETEEKEEACLVMARDTFLGYCSCSHFWPKWDVYNWNKLRGRCRVHLLWTCSFNHLSIKHPKMVKKKQKKKCYWLQWS